MGQLLKSKKIYFLQHILTAIDGPTVSADVDQLQNISRALSLNGKWRDLKPLLIQGFL